MYIKLINQKKCIKDIKKKSETRYWYIGINESESKSENNKLDKRKSDFKVDQPKPKEIVYF